MDITENKTKYSHWGGFASAYELAIDKSPDPKVDRLLSILDGFDKEDNIESITPQHTVTLTVSDVLFLNSRLLDALIYIQTDLIINERTDKNMLINDNIADDGRLNRLIRCPVQETIPYLLKKYVPPSHVVAYLDSFSHIARLGKDNVLEVMVDLIPASDIDSVRLAEARCGGCHKTVKKLLKLGYPHTISLSTLYESLRNTLEHRHSDEMLLAHLSIDVEVNLITGMLQFVSKELRYIKIAVNTGHLSTSDIVSLIKFVMENRDSVSFRYLMGLNTVDLSDAIDGILCKACTIGNIEYITTCIERGGNILCNDRLPIKNACKSSSLIVSDYLLDLYAAKITQQQS